MQDGVNVEIVITKLYGDPIQKAVVHPYTASKSCLVRKGKAYITINKTGLFTVDINGQMDDQDTGRYNSDNCAAFRRSGITRDKDVLKRKILPHSPLFCKWY